MKVVVASYSVRNGGEGVEVFVNKGAAINAVVSWCTEAGVVTEGVRADGVMSIEQARAELERNNSLTFETRECYYGIEEVPIQGGSAQQVEPLIAVSTEHVSIGAVRWMEKGGGGAVFYANEYGGFLHVAQDEDVEFGKEVPMEVVAIAKWARRQGIVWVKFDRDGNKFEDLATYDY